MIIQLTSHGLATGWSPEFQHWKEMILKSLDPSLIEDAETVKEEEYA